MDKDIRWEQRYSNLLKAMDKLKQSVEYIKQNTRDGQIAIPKESAGLVLNEMIKEGLIQRFEYTHELAWNVMKDYAEYQGNFNIGGSRDATREAFKLQLISNGDVWMDMIGSRNKTSHTYNEEITNEIYIKILNEYYQAFLEFIIVMEEKKMNNSKFLYRMIQAALNNWGLKVTEIEKMRSVFKRYAEIETVLLYGSRSKGNYKPYSDIDLSLVGKELNLTLQHKIENDLDDLLMPYKCDLSIHDSIQNKDLTAHIERVGQRFY